MKWNQTSVLDSILYPPPHLPMKLLPNPLSPPGPAQVSPPWSPHFRSLPPHALFSMVAGVRFILPLSRTFCGSHLPQGKSQSPLLGHKALLCWSCSYFSPAVCSLHSDLLEAPPTSQALSYLRIFVQAMPLPGASFTKMPKYLSHLVQDSAQMTCTPPCPFFLSCHQESVFCSPQCQINVHKTILLIIRVIYQMPPVCQALDWGFGDTTADN